MALGRWDQLLLDACQKLDLLPEKILKTIPFAKSPEKIFQAQLSPDLMARLASEAKTKVSPQVGNSIYRQGHDYGRMVLIEELRDVPVGKLWSGWDKRSGKNLWVLVASKDAVNIEELHEKALAASSVRHPGASRVIAVRRDDECIRIGLEMPKGEPIGKEKMVVGFLIPIMRDLASTVHEANQQGILHLNLTPQTIYISGIWKTKIFGFGLARALSPGGPTGPLGTPGFLAPEQVRGTETGLDAYTDVYGLGATFYALLTGQPPIPDEDPAEAVRMTGSFEPPPVRKFSSDVPEDIESIIMKCLRKKPSERFDTCGEIAEEIDHFLASDTVHATSITKHLAAAHTTQWRRFGLLFLVLAIILGTYAATEYTRGEIHRRDETDSFIRKAHSHFFDGEPAEALLAAKQARGLDPDNPLPTYWIIRCGISEELSSLRPRHPVSFHGVLGWDEWAPATPRAGLLTEIRTAAPLLPEDERSILEGLAGALEKPDDCLVELALAHKASPTDGEIRLLLGIARFHDGQFQAARKTLKPLIVGPFSIRARTTLALTWLATGLQAHFAGDPHALEQFDSGVDAAGPIDHPHVGAAVMALVMARAERLQSAELGEAAKAELRRAIRLGDAHSDDPWVRTLTAEAHLRLNGPTERCLADFKAASEGMTDEPALLLRWARALELKGTPDSLKASMDKITSALQRHESPRLQLALLRVERRRSGGFQAQVSAIDDILKNQPAYVPALFERTLVHEELARREKDGDKPSAAAIEDCRKILKIDGGHFPAALRLGRLHLLRAQIIGREDVTKAKRNHLDGLRHLNGLIKARPKLLEPRWMRAQIFAALSDLRRSEGEDPSPIIGFFNGDIDHILETDPTRGELRLFRIRLLLRLAGQGAASGRDAEKWLRYVSEDCTDMILVNGKDSEAFGLRGTAYLKLADWDRPAPDAFALLAQALDDLDRSLSLQPERPEALAMRGRAHLLAAEVETKLDRDPARHLSQAEADLTSARDEGVRTADLHLNLGRTRFLLERHEDALPDLEEAARLDPSLEAIARPLIEACVQRR